jgi:cytochrome P450
MYAAFSPEGARQVLTGTGRRYTKGNLFYRETAAMVGDGILTSEGDRWQRQKRFIQPLFTRYRVGSYVEVMAEETAALIDRWHAAVRHGGRSRGHDAPHAGCDRAGAVRRRPQ